MATGSSQNNEKKQTILIPLMWLDADINEDHNLEVRKKLMNNFGRCRFVRNIDEYKAVLEDCSTEMKFTFIVSGRDGAKLKDDFQREPKISAIYVFCRDVNGHKQWATECSKMKYITNDVEDLISKIRSDNQRS